MHHRSFKYFVLAFATLFVLAALSPAFAQKAPADTVSLKLEGAKMAPVAFSHPTHVDKAKIECTVCHHKEKDTKEYQSCLKCHLLKDAKDGAPLAKEAFHKQCQTCHKESVKKGVSAPTKCNECHKK
jgi:hypothetical protein